MVYLSANGEVIGQFEESELPSFLAAGRIGPEAFFWREGMAEWRPLRELVLPPLREPPEPAPKPAVSAAVPEEKPARPEQKSTAPEPGQPVPVRPAPAEPGPPGGPAKASTVVRKVFLPRTQAAGPARAPRPAAGPAKNSPFIIPARPVAPPAVTAGEEGSAPDPEQAAASAPVPAGAPPAKPGPFVLPARPSGPSVRAAEPPPDGAREPDEAAPPVPVRPAAPPSKRSPFVIPARPTAPAAAAAESSPAVAAVPADTAAPAPAQPAGPPPKRAPFVLPPRPVAPAADAAPVPVAVPATVSVKTPLPAARNLGIPRGGVITAPPKPAAAPGAVSAPVASPKIALPTARQGPPAAAGPPRPAPSATPAASPPAAGAAPRKRGMVRALAVLLGVLLAGGLGAAAWWFWPITPPSLDGEVRLEAADGSPAPVAGAGVFLVAREELVARWRDELAQARGRAAEIEQLLAPARAAHREKVLALELAARISELGDEYNMPDAEQLRADRDAAQAAETAAAAEVEKLARDKESAAGASALLREPPEALDRTQTDAAGAFSLPLPASTEGLAVLVVTAPDEQAPPRGWLVPLEGAEQAPAPVRLSAGNALDSAQIEEISAQMEEVADPDPAPAEESNGEPEAPR